MLTVFDIDHSVGADKYDFKQLCPAFIQQAKSGACKDQSNQTKKADTDKNMGKSKRPLMNKFHDKLECCNVRRHL